MPCSCSCAPSSRRWNWRSGCIARGFAAAALNGDLQQSQRERTVAQLKSGADRYPGRHRRRGTRAGCRSHRARGELRCAATTPNRTCIASAAPVGPGSSGEAILFIAPRERNMLHAIERATRQPIETMNLADPGRRQCQRRIAKLQGAHRRRAQPCGAAQFLPRRWSRNLRA
jgi:superfamily II DNA/RNA helicase